MPCGSVWPFIGAGGWARPSMDGHRRWSTIGDGGYRWPGRASGASQAGWTGCPVADAGRAHLTEAGNNRQGRPGAPKKPDGRPRPRPEQRPSQKKPATAEASLQAATALQQNIEETRA